MRSNFNYFRIFLEEEGGENLPIDPIRVMHGNVVLAHFYPFLHNHHKA